MITYMDLVRYGVDGLFVYTLHKLCKTYDGMFRRYFSQQVEHTDESDILLVLHGDSSIFTTEHVMNVHQASSSSNVSNVPVIILCSGDDSNDLSHLRALYFVLDQSLGIVMREEYLLTNTTNIANFVKEILKGRSANLNQTFLNTNNFGQSVLSHHNRLMKFDTIVQKLKKLSHILLTVGLLNCVNIGLGWIYCFVNFWRVRNQEIKQLEIRHRILNERAKKRLLQLSSKERCIICLINPREILLEDCGHIIFCFDCLQLIKNKHAKCIICSRPIHHTHHAFL